MRRYPVSIGTPASGARTRGPLGHTAYSHVGHTAYSHVGDSTTVTVDPTAVPNPSSSSALWRAVSIGIVGLAAYHGYRRNNSLGWAVAWAFMAGISPPVVIGVAFAQGLGERKGAS